jgi:L-rhamnose mutarotase
MERLCFTFRVRDGQEAEYDRRHDELWPEMADSLRTAGLRNYSLFRRGTEVVGYVECHPDVATALAAIGASDVNARWAEWFTAVIEIGDPGGPEHRIPEVWHLD